MYKEIHKFHQNTRFTLEKNPKKFLDTEIINTGNNKIDTKVHRKITSLPAH